MSEKNDEIIIEEVSFTAPPGKHGDYYIFHIPNALIKSGEIDPDYIYKVRVKPLKKKD